jgi:hypothetical protein
MTVLLFRAATASSAESDAQLHRLMQRFAERQHGHATFIEHQFIAVLDRPLESSGELLFDVPDRLEKRTLTPKAESVVLERGNLTIRRGSKTRTLALRDYPQYGPIIDSIRATVLGDLAMLERHYTLTFDEGGGAWTLKLIPRDKALRAQILAIRVAGAGDFVREIEIDRTNGDRSVMVIQSLPAG